MKIERVVRVRSLRVAVHVTLDPDVWTEVRRVADDEGLSASAWLERVITERLKAKRK